MKQFLFFISFLLGFTCQAQNFSFIEYSNGLGLPQSQVQCITQDEQGYLWVGTLGGLAKFNGKKFTAFPMEQGLLNNRISSLTTIGTTVWVGHEGGISQIVDGNAKCWPLPSSDRNSVVTDIVSFKNTLVIATEGAGIFVLKNNKLQKIHMQSIDAATCRDLQIIKDKLYVGTRDGIYSTTNLISFNQIKSFVPKSVSGICLKGNTVYVSTFSRGFFRTDLDMKRFDSIPLKAPDFYITRVIDDEKQGVWLVSLDGIIHWTPNYQTIITESKGLPVNAINAAYQDNEGNCWFGSDGKGLLRFCGEDLTYYNTFTGFPSDLIIAISRQKNGNYLLGTYNKGLYEMTPQGVTKLVTIPGTSIWSIDLDGNDCWIGTDQGLIYKSGKTIKVLNFSSESSGFQFVGKLKNGKRLAVSDNGIGYIENHQLRQLPIKTGDLEAMGSIRQVISYNSSLLCASSKGVFEINPNTFQIKLIKRFSSGVVSLKVDILNRVWIGTQNGLYLFNGIDYSTLKIGNNSGARFINFIEAVGTTMFVGTNNGVYVFDSKEDIPMALKHYGLNSGLINLESNINSAYYDDTYLWFGTAEGMIRLRVDDSQSSSYAPIKPSINFVQLLLNYQEFDYRNYAQRISKNGIPNQLQLPYNKNNISIELDGLLLSDPESVRFQYWLEGQDETWSPATSNTSIFLSNLSDGEYILHIRTINELGVISEECSIPITVTPPFWRTWWFYLAIILLIGAAIRYYFLWKIRQEREKNYKENLENKTRLLALEQQSLNASMNRHFIFNSLNSIQYFINTQDRISANRYLTNFAKLIRKNLDSAVEGDNMVPLAQELERLELYLSLESMRFKDRFSYKIDTDDVDIEHVVVPAMLLQPFVENSIIHGILPNEEKLGEINIVIKLIKDQLEICIDDNGIGIDFSLNKKAKFQGDHKSQGMEITSKRISLIRKMWKKDYELIGPFQMLNSDSSIKGTRVLIKIPYENLEN